MCSLGSNGEYQRTLLGLARIYERGGEPGEIAPIAAMAFLQFWGAPEELSEFRDRLAALEEWWTERTPLVFEWPRVLENEVEAVQDREASDGISTARGRYETLVSIARRAEQDIQEGGYEFDRETRTIKELKQPQADGRLPRGPRRDLLSQSVQEWCGVLMEVFPDGQRWPKRNSKELRDEIRDLLSRRFHPSLLGTERGSRIHSAVNSYLNPDRH